MPPKRKAPAKAADKDKDKGKGKAKQQKQDGQKAISRDIDVPVDEGYDDRGKWLCLRRRPSLKCLQGNVKVYVDDDGIIYDASLNQTNIGGNNNKVGSRLLASPKLMRLILCSSTACNYCTMRRGTSTLPTRAGGALVISARSRLWARSL